MKPIPATARVADRSAAADRSLLPRNQSKARIAPGLPFGAAIRPPCRQACRDRRGRLDGLLVERLRGVSPLVAEAARADGAEMIPPASSAASSASAAIAARPRHSRRFGRQARCDQGLRKPRIVIGRARLRTRPNPLRLDRRENAPSACRQATCRDIAGRADHPACSRAIGIQARAA